MSDFAVPTIGTEDMESELMATIEGLSLSPLLILSTTLYTISSVFTYIEFKNTNNPNATPAHNKESSQAEFEPRGRRGGVRRAPIRHQGREDSPVDHREGSPHTRPDPKANGEINRRLFYRYLLYSQLLRTVCLPLGYVFSTKYQITSIVAQTLPTLSSALAYSVLVIFYAQVTMTASGAGGAFEMTQTVVVKSSYTIYAILVGLNSVLPLLSEENLFYAVSGALSCAYLLLFITMTYFGLQMLHLLKSQVTKMLGCRLLTMSSVCCITFMLRSTILAWDVYSGIFDIGALFPSLPILNETFTRITVGYLTLEWLPDIAVLILMHKKKLPPPEKPDQSVQMEAGNVNAQMSPLVEQLSQGQTSNNPHDAKKGDQPIVAGFSRSHSANGGVAVSYARPTYLQQGQQRMPTNTGISRSISSGRPETVSLLGDKSQSAVASTTNPSSLYGAVNP
jgi:hypothetical protein